MDTRPIMHADDEERVKVHTISAGQKRVMRTIMLIQILLIVLMWGLLIAQLATSINFGMAAAPVFLLYIVFYLYYTKAAIALRDEGIRLRWITAVRVWSPLLFLPACIVCLLTVF